MSITKIVLDDEDVAPLSPFAVSMLCKIAKQYACVGTVHLYETIHGHIALMSREKGRYVETPEGRAEVMRFNQEDFAFLSTLPKLRWVEAYMSKIKFAFDDS